MTQMDTISANRGKNAKICTEKTDMWHHVVFFFSFFPENNTSLFLSFFKVEFIFFREVEAEFLLTWPLHFILFF